MHTLLITIRMGVWGVNMTVQIDDTIADLTFQMFSPPHCELRHIRWNLATQFPLQRPIFMLYWYPFTLVI